MNPSLPQTAHGLFVTATDTGAGKTTLLCRLIPPLERAGLKLHVRKPVESGCLTEKGELTPSDATALANALRAPPPVEQVCAYRLRHVSSPARAARLENVELTVAKLAAACAVEPAAPEDFLLVEGAGGLYSPIARDGLNADLAGALDLPLLIVVADRLGCINHALLTIEAARRRDLGIAAVVVNRVVPPRDGDTDNHAELKAATDVPVFKTDYAESGRNTTTDTDRLARYLLGGN